jgi:type I restriction enzyme M protein
MECFKVYANEIEGRIDPHYLLNKSLIENPKTKYKLIELGNLLKKPVQYGANETAIDSNLSKDIRYIRITDIDEFGNLRNDDWKTAPIIEEKYLLTEGDILFARSGATAGKCFIYTSSYGKSIFAGYLIRFVFDPRKVNPKYVFYYTQLKRYKIWVTSIQRPSGQPNINSEEFKSFKIPFPPLEIQNEIVQLMDNAYSLKKLKEAEAQKLLDSIDDYVLDELGIKLPELKDKMCYVVDSSSIRGRADPYYYQPKFAEVEEAIKEGKYGIVKIREIVDESANKTVRIENNEKYIYIEIGDINKSDGTIILKAEEFGEKLPTGSKKKLIENDVIISTVRPYLKGIAKVKNCEKNLVSTGAFCVLRCTKKINPDYLLGVVRSDLFINMVCRNMSGTTYPTVSDEDILDLETPLPPFEIQNKIAEEVKARMQKAEKLQEEAKSILEEAKEKVERIILGNEEI